MLNSILGGSPQELDQKKRKRRGRRKASAAAVVQGILGGSGGGSGGGAAVGTAAIKSEAKEKPQIEILPRGIGPIHDPNPNDVLCGRGGRINAHPGNVQFRNIISIHKTEYLSPSTKKLEKALIASKIVKQVRSMNPPGRFLKEDPGGAWYDIGDAKAMKKAGQALREDAPDIRDFLDEEKGGSEHAGEEDNKKYSAATKKKSQEKKSTSPERNKDQDENRKKVVATTPPATATTAAAFTQHQHEYVAGAIPTQGVGNTTSESRTNTPHYITKDEMQAAYLQAQAQNHPKKGRGIGKLKKSLRNLLPVSSPSETAKQQLQEEPQEEEIFGRVFHVASKNHGGTTDAMSGVSGKSDISALESITVSGMGNPGGVPVATSAIASSAMSDNIDSSLLAGDIGSLISGFSGMSEDSQEARRRVAPSLRPPMAGQSQLLQAAQQQFYNKKLQEHQQQVRQLQLQLAIAQQKLLEQQQKSLASSTSSNTPNQSLNSDMSWNMGSNPSFLADTSGTSDMSPASLLGSSSFGSRQNSISEASVQALLQMGSANGGLLGNMAQSQLLQGNNHGAVLASGATNPNSLALEDPDPLMPRPLREMHPPAATGLERTNSTKANLSEMPASSYLDLATPHSGGLMRNTSDASSSSSAWLQSFDPQSLSELALGSLGGEASTERRGSGISDMSSGLMALDLAGCGSAQQDATSSILTFTS